MNGSATRPPTSKCRYKTSATPRTRRSASWAAQSTRTGELVSLPFRDEYPGGRQWNLDAAQFRDPPADLEPDADARTIPTGT